MKITVFGATGKTGLHVVRHSLKQGHSVKAYVRQETLVRLLSRAAMNAGQHDASVKLE